MIYCRLFDGEGASRVAHPKDEKTEKSKKPELRCWQVWVLSHKLVKLLSLRLSRDVTE
jgi:hypothetical protein